MFLALNQNEFDPPGLMDPFYDGNAQNTVLDRTALWKWGLRVKIIVKTELSYLIVFF